MRKLIALCCLLGILLLSACAPTGQPVSTTTSTTTTTTTDTTVSTDDSAWSDTDWSDDFTLPEETDPTDFDEGDGDQWEDESGDYVDIYQEILPSTDNVANLLDPMTGGADAEADALREEILNSENTEYNITGTTYYISPNGDDYNDGTSPETAWKTIDNIIMNEYLFEEGDAVLFERGGIYRRNSPIVAQSGMTYGAYGEGAKPVIYGSAYNYSWGTRWQPSFKENVWKISMNVGEAGIIVFNHGEEVGMPYYHGLNELTKNGDFYHNVQDATLYLYLDKGYPSTVYRDIEIGTREYIIHVDDGIENVAVDNLSLKYGGSFAIHVNEDANNFSATNLEIGWVGGCRSGGANNTTTSIGLGNGIEIWQSTENILVENCWIYQVYDAGLSPQGINGDSEYINHVYRNNLIEFCNYSIEVFDRSEKSVWDGLVIEDNILRFAGYGWLRADERPDKSNAVAHYTGWIWNYDELPGKGIVIKNNIFDCSNSNLVYWTGKDYDSGLTISGNSFYQKTNLNGKAMAFGLAEPKFATNQAELEVAVSVFDSNPKVVKWLS